jgi:hypothetical protein
VPQLTSEAGVAGFVREHLGRRFASTKQVAEMTEALDNGISWSEDVRTAQRICDHFDEQKIEVFFCKWLRRPPHPFNARDTPGKSALPIYRYCRRSFPSLESGTGQ